MKGLLYFLGGFAVGGLSFFFVGKAAGKKMKKKEKDCSEDIRDTITVDAIDDENYDHDMFRKEVNELLVQEHYIPVKEPDEVISEYDGDIDGDIEEIDEYLSETEHPEEDVEEETLHVVDADEYYTERHEYDKVKLFLEADGSALCDALGNDYLDSFRDTGYGPEALMVMCAKANGDSIYFRNDHLNTDFEVMFEGGVRR